jgi:hypothetical protein
MKDFELLKTIPKEDGSINYSNLPLTPEQKDAYLKEFLRHEIIRKRIEERMRMTEKMEIEKRRASLKSFFDMDDLDF